MRSFQVAMIRAINIAAITVAIVVSAGGALAGASEPYERSPKSLEPVTVELKTTKIAASALADPAGLYCIDDGNSFLIGRRVGSDAYEVRITSWQGMFHCGIEGTASATPDGWLLENQGCKLQLREAGGAIGLAASPREACAPFCGARANLNGLTFPPSSQVTANPDPSLFAHDLGELNPC